MRLNLIPYVLMLVVALTMSVFGQQTANEWLLEGTYRYQQRYYNKSIECFDEVIKLNPEYTGAWFCKGTALIRQGNYDEAIKCFDETIRQDPNFDLAWFYKGVALIEQGNYDNAIKCFDEAVRLNTRYSTVCLCRDLKDENSWIRLGAALALGKINDTRAIDPLILALNDSESTVRT